MNYNLNYYSFVFPSTGFALKDKDGIVHFKPNMLHRIINLDETKLSLDGSDGGVGGRPVHTIHLKEQFRTGTATNKSGTSSTLVCGSNSFGDPLPIFIIFSSDAENEKNFKIHADWVVGIPRVSLC